MQDLEYIFHPRSIAVVGASESPLNYFGILNRLKLVEEC